MQGVGLMAEHEAHLELVVDVSKRWDELIAELHEIGTEVSAKVQRGLRAESALREINRVIDEESTFNRDAKIKQIIEAAELGIEVEYRL